MVAFLYQLDKNKVENQETRNQSISFFFFKCIKSTWMFKRFPIFLYNDIILPLEGF